MYIVHVYKLYLRICVSNKLGEKHDFHWLPWAFYFPDYRVLHKHIQFDSRSKTTFFFTV